MSPPKIGQEVKISKKQQVAMNQAPILLQPQQNQQKIEQKILQQKYLMVKQETLKLSSDKKSKEQLQINDQKPAQQQNLPNIRKIMDQHLNKSIKMTLKGQSSQIVAMDQKQYSNTKNTNNQMHLLNVVKQNDIASLMIKNNKKAPTSPPFIEGYINPNTYTNSGNLQNTLKKQKIQEDNMDYQNINQAERFSLIQTQNVFQQIISQNQSLINDKKVSLIISNHLQGQESIQSYSQKFDYTQQSSQQITPDYQISPPISQEFNEKSINQENNKLKQIKSLPQGYVDTMNNKIKNKFHDKRKKLRNQYQQQREKLEIEFQRQINSWQQEKNLKENQIKEKYRLQRLQNEKNCQTKFHKIQQSYKKLRQTDLMLKHQQQQHITITKQVLLEQHSEKLQNIKNKYQISQEKLNKKIQQINLKREKQQISQSLSFKEKQFYDYLIQQCKSSKEIYQIQTKQQLKKYEKKLQNLQINLDRIKYSLSNYAGNSNDFQDSKKVTEQQRSNHLNTINKLQELFLSQLSNKTHEMKKELQKQKNKRAYQLKQRYFYRYRSLQTQFGKQQAQVNYFQWFSPSNAYLKFQRHITDVRQTKTANHINLKKIKRKVLKMFSDK